MPATSWAMPATATIELPSATEDMARRLTQPSRVEPALQELATDLAIAGSFYAAASAANPGASP
jgi:hypothetical protein